MIEVYSPKKFFITLLLFTLPLLVFSQGPGSLFVDAGSDVVVDCSTGCTDLTADFLETFDTSGSTYGISSIPYVPPFPFNGLANPLNPNIDDAWSPVDDLPFEFCFFGNTITQFQVGSNGVVRFEVDPGDTGTASNAWDFDADLPNNTEEALAEANILLPVHDLDPTESGSEEIGYEVIGTYPNRVLVVSYYQVPMYSTACSNLLATQMVVFYEFSNVIEIYIQDKPSCPTWNDGNAALGIQNNAGTVGYVPPGRNTSDSPWTTSNEAWSFSPTGPPTYVFEWLDAAGNVIGNTPTINVCPSGTEIYTARVTYTNSCNGDVVVLTDEVEVSLQATFSVELGPDIETCGGTPITLDADTGVPTVTYQWFFNGVLIPGATNPTYTVNPPNSGNYSVEATDNGCTISDDIDINFIPQPIIASPAQDLAICDDGTGPGIFDLTENNDDVRGGQDPLFNITYHHSQLEAESGTNPIVPANAYPIVGSSEIIWVRIEEPSGLCYAVDSFEITFASATATPPAGPYGVCDTNSDGQEPIYLNDTFDATILNGQDPLLYTVTYHVNASDAVLGINPLPQPYIITGSVFIYARVENNTVSSCFATTQFNIILSPQPIAHPAPDMHQCDFGTTNGTFILTDQDPFILGAQNDADFDILYYETEELAIAGVAGTEILGGVKIIDPPSPETIWARIFDSASNTCFDITDFEIYFSRAIAGEVSDRGFCDFDGDGGEFVDLEAEFNVEVLDGQPSSDYTVTYHHSQADATADTGDITSPYFVAGPGPETIWVRLENNDDPTVCFDASQNFEISIDTAPTINTAPPNLIMCDNNNDGFATFDLSLQTDVITMGNAALAVSYHKTLVAAQSDTQELPDFYVNDQQYLDDPILDPLDPDYGTGGVWARVEAPGSSCVSIVPFALEVRFSPVGTTPDPLRVCDDAVADGIALFDLTVVAPQVLGALDPLGFDLYYFEVEAQAIAAGGSALPGPIDVSQAIPDPTNYLNTNSPYFDEIFILVVSNTTGTIPPNPNSAQGCFDVVRLELYVDPLPEDFGPFEMVLCDDGESGSATDRFSIFDLTSIEPDVTNNDLLLTVEWFLTYADEAADDPIPDPETFQNTETPQTIIGRVTSEFGCRTLVELTLEVLPNPSPNTDPPPLELCDSGPNFDDGISEDWDLTLADGDIIANQDHVAVAYYTTLAAAEAGVLGTEITMPFTNTVPFSQIVYARVQLDVPPAVLPCHTIVELELIVVPAPDAPQMPPFQDPFIGCDESGSGTGIFDLTLQGPGVIGIQDPAEFAPITYYDTTFDDAMAGLNAIPAPGSYISGGGVPIWVRLESLVTGCVRVTEFQLELELFPAIGVGDDLFECDDLTLESSDTDGTAVFDLTVNTPLIQLGDPGLEVSYYATPIDQSNDDPILGPGAYRNIVPGQQRIYVTAFSGNGCRATNSFLIVVDPAAIAFSPGTVVACDSDNDGYALFDLAAQTDFINDGNAALTVSYHRTLLDAQNDELPIAAPYQNDEIYLDAPVTDPADPLYGTGGVWVRVENDPAINDCPRVLSFALEVHTSPVATVPDPLRMCDLGGDGVEEFDLTGAEPDILGTLDPGAYDIYFYENLADAQTAGDLALTAPDFSLAIADPAAYPNTSSPQQTIYVLVVGNANSATPPNPNGGEGCYDIVELLLILDPVPGNNGPFTMDKCDDAVADGFTTFDLTENDLLITGGDPNLTVTWFDSLGDPILDPENYANINTPETVVGVVTSEFGCSNSASVTLTVHPNPVPNMDPEPMVLCDDGDDGIMVFDLNERTEEIRNGEDDVAIVYYGTLELAMAAAPFTEIFGGIYENTRSPYSDTVFARVTNNVPPEVLPCYTIVELDLEVVALPDMPDANFQEEITECDEDGDGDAIFDLTSQNLSVYGSQDPADFEPIAYYEVEQDAIDGTANFIDPAILAAYESVSRPIWVRLESLATGCARVTRFELIVGEFPGSGTADDLVLCDDEGSGSAADGLSIFDLTLNTPVITGGDPTLTVIYYASFDDFNNNIPIATPSAYQNIVSPQQEIFYTASGQNSCSDSQSFLITVDPNPQPVQPAPLAVCDVDNDGFASFNLESKTLEIQGTDPTIIVTYHENLSDADSGDFPLASPYENIIAFNQTLYVRAAFAGPPAGTGCYAIVTLELIVRDGPTVPQDLPGLVACGDGGTAVFDLTVQEGLILGNPPQADVAVTYHLTEADAIAGTDFIVAPESYTNAANPQTIWVRVDDDLTECFAIGSFDLIVNSGLPITDPTPLESCDDLGGPNDGITAFNLTLKNGEITNGVLTQGVSYFLTEGDAQLNENRIDPETAYVNVDANGNAINPQVLYVRVEDSNSACVSYTTLTIRVIPNPIPVDPLPIELCDYNVIVPPGPYDEVEIFDLTIREAQILNGNNWTVGYYESYENAVNDLDAIPALETTAYQNLSNPQTIYVRAANPGSLCFEIVELELVVNPLPDDTAAVSPYVACATDGGEIAVFNLETKVDEILGGQPRPPFEVTFYLNGIDAANQENHIVGATTFQNTTNPQTIFTGILNAETGCYIGGVQFFELIVQPGAIANTPAEPFIICDNLAPSDGFAEFDLDDATNQQVSGLRAEILAGQDPSTFLLTFHETIGEAEAGENPIVFPYVNIINPQRIYVRVTNDSNLEEPKCYAVVELVLKVEQLPDIALDGEYRICVDGNGNPVPQEEGGPSPPVIDTGLDPNLYAFQWDLDGVIVPGETGPSIIALEGGVYTVLITELASGCESTATATVIVSSPPFVYEANLLNGAFAGNHVIEVIAEGEGAYEYQLDGGPFQDGNIFENVEPGNHTVTIRDKFGCGSVTFDVGVIDYPLYFTPNADGYHDTWNIIGIAAGDPAAKIYVFDRFGKLLKQLSPLGEGWDGNYGGSPMPSSDYWFRIEYTEDGGQKEFKGHFTLKR